MHEHACALEKHWINTSANDNKDKPRGGHNSTRVSDN